MTAVMWVEWVPAAGSARPPILISRFLISPAGCCCSVCTHKQVGGKNGASELDTPGLRSLLSHLFAWTKKNLSEPQFLH